jgi:hypothetical protein
MDFSKVICSLVLIKIFSNKVVLKWRKFYVSLTFLVMRICSQQMEIGSLFQVKQGLKQGVGADPTPLQSGTGVCY